MLGAFVPVRNALQNSASPRGHSQLVPWYRFRRTRIGPPRTLHADAIRCGALGRSDWGMSAAVCRADAYAVFHYADGMRVHFRIGTLG